MFSVNKKTLLVCVAMLVLVASRYANATPLVGDGANFGVLGNNTNLKTYGYLGLENCAARGDFYNNNGYVVTGGYLGSLDYGASGRNFVHETFGYLGSQQAGVEGWNNRDTAYACLGYGVYGTYSYASGIGVWGEHVREVNASTKNGTFGLLGSDHHAVYASHSSGSYGYLCSVDNGAFVAHPSGSKVCLADSSWGAYIYAPYFRRGLLSLDSARIGGKGCGVFAGGKNFGVVGFSGKSFGLLGAIERVGVFGFEVPPFGDQEDYAGLFFGDVMIEGSLWVKDASNKHDVVELDSGTWAVMTSVESPDAEYIISGKARLRNGKVRVEFERPFPQVISGNEPVRVLVTPEGSWSGIYITDVSVKGFTALSQVGDSNANFSFMAIGRVKGKETRPDTKGITKMMREAPSLNEIRKYLPDLKQSGQEQQKMLEKEEKYHQEIEKMATKNREEINKHQAEMEKSEKTHQEFLRKVEKNRIIVD